MSVHPSFWQDRAPTVGKFQQLTVDDLDQCAHVVQFSQVIVQKIKKGMHIEFSLPVTHVRYYVSLFMYIIHIYTCTRTRVYIYTILYMHDNVSVCLA